MRISAYFLLPYLCFGSYASKAQTTFSYTGSTQTYTVPACVYSIHVDVKGAEGAGSSSALSTNNKGGKGGRVQATIPVTPGEVLTIYVGQAGKLATSTGTGGGNGGGAGGTTSGGGGGASDIRSGGTALTNRIVVAGGGGGAGVCSTCSGIVTGGAGGDSTGANGFYTTQDHVAPGRGGSQTEGGAAGSEANPGVAGDLGVGGNGGGNYGGGGGGGYYGGGGGATNICCWGGGGGGGSSYTMPGAMNVQHKQGFQTGNGEVVITAGTPGPAAPDSIIGPDSACISSIVSYFVNPVSGADSYAWAFPAGTTINSGEGADSVVVTLGSLSGDVSVTTTNTCGTSAASTKTLNVIDCGGGTGIDNSSHKEELSVSPNPAGNVLHIQMNNNELRHCTITLLNTRGQVVYNSYEDNLSGTYHKQVDISTLSRGVYYLQIKEADFFAGRKIVFIKD